MGMSGAALTSQSVYFPPPNQSADRGLAEEQRADGKAPAIQMPLGSLRSSCSTCCFVVLMTLPNKHSTLEQIYPHAKGYGSTSALFRINSGSVGINKGHIEKPL